MKKLVYIIIVAFLLLIGGYFLMNKKVDQSDLGPIKIGVASLLSGDYSVVGENIRDTAQLLQIK